MNWGIIIMWDYKVVIKLFFGAFLLLGTVFSVAQRGGNIRRGRQVLPEGRQTFQKTTEKKKLLRYVKPSSQFKLYYDEGTDEAELEKITLLEIQQLYDILKTSNRPDIQIRLASLYVEQARLVENRLYEKYTLEMEKYKRNEIQTLPRINLSSVQEYSRKAIRLFESYLTGNPRSQQVDEVLFHLAYAYSQIGQLPKMLQTYQRLVRSYPKSPYTEQAYFEIGEYYFDQRNWKKARVNYDRASRARGRFYSFSIYKIGWCLYNEGQVPLAMKFMERVIRDARSPRFSQSADFSKEALDDLASFYAYSSAHKASQAHSYFNNLTTDETQLFKIFKKIAFLYKDIGKMSSMRYIFNTLISWNPYHPEAYDFKHQIVQAYSYAGQNELFNKEFEEWIRDYSFKSEWYRRNRSDSVLVSKVDTLLEVSVRNYAFRMNHSYNKTKRASSRNQAFFGYELYFNYFNHTKMYPEMVFHYGELLFDLERYLQASRQYKIVIDKYRKNKTYPLALLNRVLALEKTLPSEAQVKKQFASGDSVSVPKNVLDFKDAVDAYTKHFPKKSSNVNMIYTLAQILYEYKEYSDAIRYWTYIIKNDIFKKSKLYVQSIHSVLDTHNLMKDYEGLYTVAQEFVKMPLVQNSSAYADVQKILREIEFKRAQDLAVKGNLKGSAQMYEQFYENNPRSQLAVTALYNAAINYEKMNKKIRALRIYNRLLKVPNLSKHPKIKDKIFMVMPEIYQNQGLYLKAAYAFKEYGVQFPKNKESAQYWYNAALIFDGVNSYEEATRSYLEYYKRTSSEEKNQIYFLIGRMRERQGQIAKAIGNYKVYLNSPDSNKFTQVLASFKIAELNKNMKNFKEAQKWYSTTLSLHKRNKAGILFAAQSQFYFAHRVYNEFKALRIPNQPSRQAAAVQKKLNLLEKLKSEVKKVIEINEGSQTVASLALMGLANKNMAEAILKSTLPKGLSAENLKKYKEGLQQTATPFIKSSEEYFSQSLKRANSFKGLAPWVKEVRKGEFRFNEVVYNLRLTDEVSLASKSLATNESTKNTLASKERKMIQAFKDKRTSEFLKWVVSILTEDEKNQKALRLLYTHHYNRNQFGLSRIIIERTLSDNPKQPEPHLYKGLMALKENQKDQAVSAFLEALKIRSRYYPALVNLSSVYMQYYDYEKALPLLRSAYGIVESSEGGPRTSEHFKVANNYGVTLVWAQRNNLAKRVFTNLTKKDKVPSFVLVNYARFLIEALNDVSEAESILEEARFLTREKRIQNDIRELRTKIQKIKRRKA